MGRILLPKQIFSHPDFTVGTGFSPVQHRHKTALTDSAQGFTVGVEFHQPPKIFLIK